MAIMAFIFKRTFNVVAPAGFRRLERSELAALSAVATTDLLAVLVNVCDGSVEAGIDDYVW